MRQRRKILILVDQLALGGGETVAVNLACLLDQGKYEVMVCASRRSGPLYERLAQAGIPVYIANRQSTGDVAGLWSMMKVIREFRPDIIHSHMFGSNIWGRMLRPVTGTSVHIAHDHGSTYGEHRSRMVIDKLTRALVDTVIAPSEYDRSSIIRSTGIPSEKVQVIYNATAPITSPQLRLRNELRINDSAFVFGAVGGLRPIKGYKFLLDAFQAVAGRIANAHLVIIGEGSEMVSLQQQIATSGLTDRIHLPGSRVNAASYIQEFDTFVNSSLSEGLPLSILNAMSVSKPIIASRVGGIPEAIVHNETGILVAPQSVDTFADEMIRISREDQLRCRLGIAAEKRWRSLFTVRNMIEQVEGLYESMLDRKAFGRSE